MVRSQSVFIEERSVHSKFQNTMAVTITKAKVGVCLLSFIGVVLVVIGITALSVLPSLFKAKVAENLVLQEGKETFDKWKKTPLPVQFTIYLWNYTNPEEVEKGGRPFVQEVGPYVFEQMRSKNILDWDPEEMTVTYDDIKTYHFVPNKSVDPNYMIYSLNMPLLGMSQTVKKLPSWVQSLVAPTMDDLLHSYNNSLFVHKPAHVLLFDGYKVDVLEDLLGVIRPFYKVPEVLPNNTFGFFYGKNNSGDGRFTVYTGEDDIFKYTQIQKWNGNSHLLWWENDYCDMLNGTDGAQFAPPVSKNDILYVYAAELCRSLYLEYVEEVTVRDIPTLRFAPPQRLFESPLSNPDNQCYCKRPDYCHLSGILEIATCRKGIPLAVTGPHFFEGHESFIKLIDGMNPVEETHKTYVDIEPTTGLVLRASRKLQMNYILEKFEDFRQLANVNDAIFPLLWIIEGATIDENIANMFNSKVRAPVTIAKSVLTACIVLGILWILTAGFVTVYVLIKQQKSAGGKLKAHYKAVPMQPIGIDPKREKAMNA